MGNMDLVALLCDLPQGETAAGDNVVGEPAVGYLAAGAVADPMVEGLAAGSDGVEGGEVNGFVTVVRGGADGVDPTGVPGVTGSIG